MHRENGIPVQSEDRYVDSACAPKFLKQSFRLLTPSEYLLAMVPADESEHTVDSVVAGKQAALLGVKKNDPYLLLTRRTWSCGKVVTFARLLYPASRYRLSCRFKPSSVRDRG